MSGDPEVMGRNEYAKHRRVSPNAVTKAVLDGRIADAAVMAGDRIVGIRWRLADRLWEERTDPAAALKNGSAPPPAATQEPAVERFQTRGKRGLADVVLPRMVDSLTGQLVWEAQLVVRNYGVSSETALEIVEELMLLHLGAAWLALGRDPTHAEFPPEIERALDEGRGQLLRQIHQAAGHGEPANLAHA